MRLVSRVSCGALICFTCQASADTLVLKQGRVLNGTVTGASSDSISFALGSEGARFAKEDVLTIVFSSADVLFMKDGEQRECKVAAKTGDSVVVATPSGPAFVSNALIDEVKYNIGHELTVPGLPETSRQFVNRPNRSVWVGDFKSNITIRTHLNFHFASLADWKNQFTSTSGDHPSTLGLAIAGELGYEISRNVKIGAGYEYCFFPTAHVTQTSPTFDDKVSFAYIYGGVKLGGSPRTLPELFVYGGADAGVVRGVESVKFQNGVELDGVATVVAPRLRAGVDYFLGSNFSISSELAYLIADVKDLRVLGSTISNYTLNMSGVSIIAAFVFHLPLQ